jgi:hypothetical protein
MPSVPKRGYGKLQPTCGFVAKLDKGVQNKTTGALRSGG